MAVGTASAAGAAACGGEFGADGDGGGEGGEVVGAEEWGEAECVGWRGWVGGEAGGVGRY